jgi:hypothetical protein
MQLFFSLFGLFNACTQKVNSKIKASGVLYWKHAMGMKKWKKGKEPIAILNRKLS